MKRMVFWPVNYEPWSRTCVLFQVKWLSLGRGNVAVDAQEES